MVAKMKNFLKFKTGENNHDPRKFGEEFYLQEAKLWRPFRWFGIFSTVTAMTLTLASILSASWVHGTDTARRTISNSIWESCLHNTSSSTQCLDTLPHWQNAVIGLMLFAALFGVIAGVLAVCGVCTSPLPRKIYYFHSSGEIFFVCALSTCTALIIYPISISMDENIATYTYGSGYGTGWGAAVFFLLAALCMSLDDLVRESSQNKFCRLLCWKSNDRDQQQQV